MAKFSMSDYGDLKYRYEAMSDKGKLKYMMYNDYKYGIELFLEESSKSSDKILWYIGTLKQGTKTRNIQTPKPYRDINSYLYEKDTPKAYSYNYSQTKNKDTFNVLFSIGDRDIKIAVDKNKHVFYYPNSKRVVICNKDNNPVEKFLFTDNGYINIDESKPDIVYCVFGECINPVEFKVNKKSNTGISVLDNRLLYADYVDTNELFKTSIDEYGMIYDVFKDGISYSRSEAFGVSQKNKNKYKERLVVKPLLYDTINYNYIGDPLKYYSEDRLLVDGSCLTFYRNVYEVEKFDDMINALTTMSSCNHQVIEFNE